MSSFTQPLILEALPTTRNGQGEFLVHKPFYYDVGHEGSGDTIIIPKGFNTDLCSVPAIARVFIPLSGKVAKPALVHDYLVTQNSERHARIFDEALKVAKVKPLKRRLLVLSVSVWIWLKREILRKSG